MCQKQGSDAGMRPKSFWQRSNFVKNEPKLMRKTRADSFPWWVSLWERMLRWEVRGPSPAPGSPDIMGLWQHKTFTDSHHHIPARVLWFEFVAANLKPQFITRAMSWMCYMALRYNSHNTPAAALHSQSTCASMHRLEICLFTHHI